MNHTSNQPNQREAIVDKLHGALSVLRRERDELHRAKELASERFRLAKEERVNAEQNLSSLTAKFNRIESADGKHNRKTDIERLQAEVDRLGREVKFQHAELVGKREKMNRLEARIAQEESTRKNQLQTAKEALRCRREKVSRRQANEISVSLPADTGDEYASARLVQKIEEILDDNAENLDFFVNIQRLLDKKCEEVEHEVSIIKNESGNLKRRIAGYENYLCKDHGIVMSMQMQTNMTEQVSQQ